MRISDVTREYFKGYARIDWNHEDDFIDAILLGGKAFVSNYTGLSYDEIDNRDDIAIAYLVICNDMYTQRQYAVDKDKLNPVADLILNMHSVNLL